MVGGVDMIWCVGMERYRRIWELLLSGPEYDMISMYGMLGYGGLYGVGMIGECVGFCWAGWFKWIVVGLYGMKW